MKKIRIIIAAILCTVLACILSACSFIGWVMDDWLTKDQKEITDSAMREMCTAISKRDTAGIKALFSQDDICRLTDFDASVIRLIDYIEGENISFKRFSSGSDGAAMGGYPREREFDGVRYNIFTSTDEYKVIFGYRSYYRANFRDDGAYKIGFKYFDIINKKYDREGADGYYSGCPYGNAGINFDYKTIYGFGEFDYYDAYYEKGKDIEPAILSSVRDIEAFYERYCDLCTLEEREDGKGFKDIVARFDDAFFEAQSLYVVGMYNGGGGYMYVPQYLYIDDLVMTEIAIFEDDNRPFEHEGEFEVNGVILFIELPENLPNDTKTELLWRNAF